METTVMTALESLHFLRPEWFWALLPLLLGIVLLARGTTQGGNWQAVVDPALLPHLLIGEQLRSRRWPLPLLTLLGVLAVTALAGPVWQKMEQPLFRQDSSLVVLLDLSSSMDATDSKPSRLARARLKVKDILERRHEGETALITFAADAFVVTPLTSDSRTIASQLSGMTTDLMPAQGSRPDLALQKGRDLLKQAGRVSGSLLLVSDGIEGTPAAALSQQIAALTAEGYQLLVLGVGSEEGAPIPQPGGGFLKDNAGNIVLAALNWVQMEGAARRGGGIYRALADDSSDLDALLGAVDAARPHEKGAAIEGQSSDQWQEEGPWLLLPVLLLSLLVFRRGMLLVALVMLLPVPREGLAAGLDTLWLSRDQQAQQAFEKGESKAAAELFDDPAWRAAAHYKSGDYPQALKELTGVEGAEAAYNRGNALAQMGKLDEALKAYEEALKQEPGMADAAFNRDRVKEWLKESEQQQKQDKSGESDKSSEQQGEGKEGDSQSKDKPGEQQQGDSQAKDKPGNEQQGDSQANSANPEQADPSSSSTGDNKEGDEAKSEAAQSEPQKEESANNDSQTSQQQESAAARQEAKDKDEAAKQLAEQLRQQATQSTDEQKASPAASVSALSPEEREQQQATEQWLRRISDDPSGLWRRKFLYQYKNQQQPRGEEERPW
jgi:Ca-activated chloride channel family protein